MLDYTLIDVIGGFIIQIVPTCHSYVTPEDTGVLAKHIRGPGRLYFNNCQV